MPDDISNLIRSEKLNEGQRRILERLALGASLQEVLDLLLETMEGLSPGLVSSILLLDSQKRLRHAASRNLPEFYIRAIDGIEAGPTTGSCGRAAFTGEQVVVEDIRSHPYWSDYREIAESAGLRACWSQPIISSKKTVLGTFAMYFREPRCPYPYELDLARTAAHLASISVERSHCEAALRRSEETFRGVFQHSSIGMAVASLDGRLLQVNRSLCEMVGYSEGELRRKTVGDFLFPGDLEEILALRQQFLNGPTKSYQGENRIMRRSGQPLWSRCGVSLVRDSGNKPVYFVLQVQDISETKLAEIQLQGTASRLQSLSQRILDTQETERRHIALELHDEIGQILTGLKLSLEDCILHARISERARLGDALDLVMELMRRVRDMSFRIRPALLDHLGLHRTLIRDIERYTSQTGIHISFGHSGLEGRRFPPGIETAAYRIIQEALTNIARHSGVREARLFVDVDTEKLSLSVEDTGRGFVLDDARENARTCGLAGMHERAAAVAGEVTIRSSPGSGTCVRAVLPLLADHGEEAKTNTDRPGG